MRTACIIVGIALAGFVASAKAQRVGDIVTIDQSDVSDEYVAGRIIRVRTAIEGDLLAAGQEIIVDGPVGGDLIAAGDTLQVLEPIFDDVRLAGRVITIESAVAGHLVAAGDQVELASSASVDEWVWIAGRSLLLNGRVAGELRAAGEQVTVSGEFDGDAVIKAERVEIESTSIFRGDLTIQSTEEPVIAAGATVQGELVREELPGGSDRLGDITGSLVSTIAVIIAAITVYLTFSGFSGTVTRRVRKAPLPSLGIGLGVAILMPVLVIVLFITGIGFWLGLGLLAAYLLSLLLGMLFGLISVSGIGLGMIAGRDREISRLIRVLAVAVGVIVLLFLGQIPYVGSVLVVAVGIIGLGALITELWQSYCRTPS